MIKWDGTHHVLRSVARSCPTLCHPMDSGPSGSSVHGDSPQARILEWDAMPSSRGSSQPRDWAQVSHTAGGFSTIWATRGTLHIMKVKSLSRVRLFETPWTVAHRAPPSMGFSRQEYWKGLPFPSPGDLPNPGIEPRSPSLQADALTFGSPGKPGTWGLTAILNESYFCIHVHICERVYKVYYV